MKEIAAKPKRRISRTASAVKKQRAAPRPGTGAPGKAAKAVALAPDRKRTLAPDRKRTLGLALKAGAGAAVMFGLVLALIGTGSQPSGNLSAPPSRTSATVQGTSVAVRSAPKLNAKIVNRAHFGTRVEVTGHDGGWVKIHGAQPDISGWMEETYLKF